MSTSRRGKLVAAATASNNLAVIAWDGPLTPGCLGYEIIREDSNGNQKPLGQHKRFQGDTNPDFQPLPTSVMPWQDFIIRDLTSRLGDKLRYRVSPVFGSPAKPTVDRTLQAVTNWVELTPDCGPHLKFAANNGFLSSQFITRQLPLGADGKPDGEVLRKRLEDTNDPLWRSMTAGLDQFILSCFDRARDIKGSIIAMLYELSSGRALSKMEENATILKLLLGNSGKDDEGNAPGRKRMKDAGVQVHDMMVADGHIFHLKVFILLDAMRKAIEVTTGSTNVTDNGFSVQANNALRILSPEVAELFVEFADELIKDNSALGSGLRQWCAKPPKPVTLPDGSVVEVYFSPCTPTAEKPAAGTWSPNLQRLWDAFMSAERSIHFNAFMPGNPSIVDMIKAVRDKRPDLIIEGTVNSKQSLGRDNYTLLFHKENTDPMVIPAAAFEGADDGDWKPELLLLPGAHAAVHSKCGVIDFGGKKPVVFTGSDNLGAKAGAFNVENLVFVTGNQLLAGHMFGHCTDVREHYISRFLEQDTFVKTDRTQYLTRDDSWQKRYPDGGPRAKKHAWLVEAMQAAAGLVTA